MRIPRRLDDAILAVGVFAMAAVSVVFTAPLWIADAVRGRRHAGRCLDHTHIDGNGDRLPVGDDEAVRMLVRREWR